MWDFVYSLRQAESVYPTAWTRALRGLGWKLLAALIRNQPYILAEVFYVSHIYKDNLRKGVRCFWQFIIARSR